MRERLAEALDEADRGMPVVIERRGVRYTLSVDRPARRRTRGRLDTTIADGQWTWDLTPDGVRFRPRRRP